MSFCVMDKGNPQGAEFHYLRMVLGSSFALTAYSAFLSFYSSGGGYAALTQKATGKNV